MNTEVQVTHYKMLVGGRWVDASDGKRFDAINPFNCEVWATAPLATKSDIDDAVAAARQAFETPSWRDSTPAFRAKLLRQLGACIEANVDKLARIQVSENGKLIREVHGQTLGLAQYCYYFAGAAEQLHGETIPLSVPNVLNYTVREPIGVVAAITPWNSPLSLLMWKLAPAVAAGNTVVVKPSEVTPISTLLLGELFEQAGFPAGVVNIVTGLGDAGAALVDHPDVSKVAFTGSTSVGKSIAAKAGERLVGVSLELGGKSPNIVFEDADISGAVNGLLAGIFAASGQTCIAGSRALIQSSIYDEVVKLLVERTRKIIVGDPQDMATEMGTIACRPQFEKVLRYIEIAKDEGAKLLTGGRRMEEGALGRGLFVEPTIFGNVTNGMRIAQEEVFGPILTLLRFDSEADAISIANDTRFGLAAGIWTNDVKRAHRVASRLRAGTVWVNTYRKTNYASPFGGFKESGLGRENGLDVLREYTEVKSIWVDLGAGIRDPFNPRG